MNDTVATEDPEQPDEPVSEKLVRMIGIMIVGLHQGQRTYMLRIDRPDI
jgi:hypothetical protein